MIVHLRCIQDSPADRSFLMTPDRTPQTHDRPQLFSLTWSAIILSFGQLCIKSSILTAFSHSNYCNYFPLSLFWTIFLLILTPSFLSEEIRDFSLNPAVLYVP